MHLKTGKRAPLIFVTALATMFGSGVARASSVQVVLDSAGYAKTAARLAYTAGAGEANQLDVTVRASGDLAVVTDPGASLTGGRNCDVLALLAQVDCFALGNETYPGITRFSATFGDGNDTLSLTRVSSNGYFRSVTVDGGPGDDELVFRYAKTPYIAHVFAHGGTGDDYVSTATTNGSGNLLYGDAGNDVVEGGNSDDQLTGGPGDDRLAGNGANDTFYVYGGGADDISGGGGRYDYVPFYSAGGPLSVSLDDVANDGVAGQGANVHSDVEDVSGTDGYSNTLTGSAAANILNGGNLGDVIDGRGDSDLLFGAAGDDVIYANDGVNDLVNCGPGTDVAHVDALDTVSNCETVVP